jgi:CelD/BcsL family acetyltransferase involved in cellulose biosynthesis
MANLSSITPLESGLNGVIAPVGEVSAPTDASIGIETLSVEVIADLAGLEAAADDWHALEATTGPNAVFQSFSHTLIWARHFLEGGASRKLHVVVVREAGEAKLILPLGIHQYPALRLGKIAGDPVAQYSEILADPEADLAACFKAALKSLREDGIDLLELDGVRDDSLLLRAALDRVGPRLHDRIAQYSDLTVAPDHDKFVRGLSMNHFRSIRQRRAQADKAGSVNFEIIEGGPGAGAAMAQAMDMKRDWLVERGAISSAFLNDTTKRVLKELATHSPNAIVMLMMFEGETAALRFGFEYLGEYFAYLSAYSSKLAKFSPGKLLLDFTFMTERDRGTKVIDMLPPAGEHKKIWCNRDVGVADYALALSMKGAFYTFVQQHFESTMRWTWNHLPGRLRSFIATKLLKL